MKLLSKKKKMTAAGVVIVLALLLIAVGYERNRRENEFQFAEEAEDGPYVLPTRAPGSEDGPKETSYFTIQVNASPTVSGGGSRCNLMIGNPEENEQYARVKLILDETGEELFLSEILKPGERDAYVDLEQVPEAGEHRATAVFMIYDPESMEQITEIDAGVLLTVR